MPRPCAPIQQKVGIRDGVPRPLTMASLGPQTPGRSDYCEEMATPRTPGHQLQDYQEPLIVLGLPPKPPPNLPLGNRDLQWGAPEPMTCLTPKMDGACLTPKMDGAVQDGNGCKRLDAELIDDERPGNGSALTEGSQRVLTYIEAQFALVQKDMNQRHDSLVISFQEHRKTITEAVRASLSRPSPAPQLAESWHGNRGHQVPEAKDICAANIVKSAVSEDHNANHDANHRHSAHNGQKRRSIDHVRSSLAALDLPPPGDVEDPGARDSWATTNGGGILKKGRTGRLDAVFRGKGGSDSPVFDMIIGIVIMLNALVTCLYSQWEGYKAAIQLGTQMPDNGWNHANEIFAVFEHIFCVIFSIELILRLRWLGRYFFYDTWNCFDAFLVLTSLADLYVMRPLESGSGTNVTLLRLARIFKLVKVLRVVRVLKIFSSLRVLVKTISSSFTSLIWSMVLLGVIMCLGGIFLVQTLVDYINDESYPYALRLWLYKHYGTSLRGMLTMFEVTLSGCWPNYARRLIDEVSAVYAIFWVIYVSIVVFAVIRIITALFLKHTMENAGSDADLMIAAQMRKKRAYLEKLGEAFTAIDDSGDGTITREEFEEILNHPQVKAYLAVLDLEVHESNSLFNLLEEDEDGVITYAEFLEGVMRLKGQARTLDIVEIQRDCKRLMNVTASLCDVFEKVHGVDVPNNPRASRLLHTKPGEGSGEGAVARIRASLDALPEE